MKPSTDLGSSRTWLPIDAERIVVATTVDVSEKPLHPLSTLIYSNRLIRLSALTVLNEVKEVSDEHNAMQAINTGSKQPA